MSSSTDVAAVPGRVALVAGGSRGLGLLVARELGRRGHRLVICARDGAELERAAAAGAVTGRRAGGGAFAAQTQVCRVVTTGGDHPAYLGPTGVAG